MKTCLVADDSSVIRKIARRILEEMNFQIVEAEDGEQALEPRKLLRRNFRRSVCFRLPRSPGVVST